MSVHQKASWSPSLQQVDSSCASCVGRQLSLSSLLPVPFTVSASHSIDVNGLLDVLEVLPAGVDLRLIIVCPI